MIFFDMTNREILPGKITLLKNKSTIDFNRIFTAINILLFIVIFLFYSFNDFPQLVNGITLIIYLLLFSQVQFFLYYEKRHRNPFILVLVYVITFFYFSRILTLFWTDIYNYASVLNRLRAATVNDINFTLFFILIANIFIFLGLIQTRKTINLNDIVHSKIRLPNPKIIILLFLVAVFLPKFAVNEVRVFGALNKLIEPYFLIPFIIVYFVSSENRYSVKYFYKSNRSIFQLCLSVILLYLIVIRVLGGQRSAILSFIQTAFFSILALGIFKIPKKIVFTVALLLVISIPIFTIATYVRYLSTDNEIKKSFVQKVDLFQTASNDSKNLDFVRILIPAFDRAAFLDFSVDLMKNSKEYSSVVNIWNQFKSTVDGLTPGFDVFNTPKSSNALIYIWGDMPPGPMVRIDSSFYQSDQFNVYGEYYVAFGGWLSLPVFFLAAFGFKAGYLRIKFKSFLATYIWKFLIIMLFCNWVLSFGTDWLIIAGVNQFFILYLLLLIIDKSWVFSSFRKNSAN